MNNLLFNNESLKNFIEGVNLSKDRKDFLISKLPEMDLEERQKLFKVLSKIYLLDLEEKEAIEKVKKFWQK